MVLGSMIALVVGWYTLTAHKEFRFVLPAMQLLIPLVGLSITDLLGSSSRAAFPRDASSHRHGDLGANGVAVGLAAS